MNCTEEQHQDRQFGLFCCVGKVNIILIKTKMLAWRLTGNTYKK